MFTRCFQGNLESFADAWLATGPHGTPVSPGSVLRDAAALSDMIAGFCAERGCTEARAGTSEWSRWFFCRLIVSITVIQLETNRQLAGGWDELSIGWRADATPRCFVVDPQCFEPGDGTDLSGLIDGLLSPLIDALTKCCRLSPRVFWSNAAVYHAWTIDELERQRRIPAARLAAARAMLATRTRANGAFNPFYRAYRSCRVGALDGNGRPATCCRRVCCVRDLNSPWGRCANCPRALYFDHRPRIALGG